MPKPKKEVLYSKNTKVLSNVLEWLYLHDGGYDCKGKWREAFVEMLKANLK